MAVAAFTLRAAALEPAVALVVALGAKAVQMLWVEPVVPAVRCADGRLVVHLARDVAAARVGRVAVERHSLER